MSEVLTLDEFKRIKLAGGGHNDRSAGELCTMEAVAWLAGEPHSAKPQCACPVIGAFIRTWQDKLADDMLEELCRDMVPQLVNSRVGDDATDRRAVLVADWCQRVVLPLWCDLVPSLAADAAALRALPEACTVEQLAEPIRVAIVDLAKQNAAAAGDAAGDAAWFAARDAAWDAAGAAARDAAWAAAGAAAWFAARDAAWDAAGAAAWAAARAAVNPTKISIWRTVPAMIARLLQEGDGNG